ncbi:aldo/keto reductase [Streptomyces sp. NPDC052299]|uniref:aldo/keto reductase n=1 Tax=Streptomyces sp. NPDC052299 TaxID=3155054 RepID=UPI0034318487
MRSARSATECGASPVARGGWTGADDTLGRRALDEAVERGCTFFDTAWIYGRGHSEQLLGELLSRHPGRELYVATKIPPKDRAWPSTRASRLEDVFPEDHIREYTRRSLDGLGVDAIDLLQFHVWEDSWAEDRRWQDPVREFKEAGLVRGVGISVNRWEPWNVLRTLETGLIDAVQVGFNIFDQSPADELLPVCQEMDIAVIARVPFDEGALTGRLTAESSWPEGDWRNSYFVPENLVPSVRRVAELMPLLPEGMTLPELALRFVLAHPAVSTVIPGMRTPAHVGANLAVSDGRPLPDELLAQLHKHRWDREPTWWSQ